MITELASPTILVLSWRSPPPTYHSYCCKLSILNWLINDDDDDDDEQVILIFTSLVCLNIQGDVSEEVNILDGKTVGKDDSDDSTETGSESESSEDILNVTNQSPVSGSINYFVAPLDSSETQAMVIEELNQVRLKPGTQGLFCHCSCLGPILYLLLNKCRDAY